MYLTKAKEGKIDVDKMQANEYPFKITWESLDETTAATQKMKYV